MGELQGDEMNETGRAPKIASIDQNRYVIVVWVRVRVTVVSGCAVAVALAGVTSNRRVSMRIRGDEHHRESQRAANVGVADVSVTVTSFR